MAKPIIYDVPCRNLDGIVRFEQRTGQPILITIGDEKHRFAIQEYAFRKQLTHVASGVVVGNMNDMGIRLMRSCGGSVPPDRYIARRIIAALIDTHGADKVNASLRAKLDEVNDYREALGLEKKS